MLILSRKAGESLFVNEDIEIKIVEVLGDKVKIGISAPKDVKILRSELRQTLESNMEASSSVAPTNLRNFLSGFKK